MALRFSPAPLSTHSATPPTHPAKAAMATTAAMAAAPHDGFDHAAIPNNDALLWPRVPHGPEAAESALGPRALVSSHGQRCRHNLAHDSSHDPAHDLARDPAKGG